MSIKNCQTNLRNQKLRLNRLIDNIITKDFDVDPALQNQAKTRAHHEKIFAIKADQNRITRALEDLKHSQEEYAETIDRICKIFRYRRYRWCGNCRKGLP